MKRLKYVATVVAGQSPKSADVRDFNDGIPFIQGNAEFGARHPAARLQCALPPKMALPGDLLVSVRAPVGALNLAEYTYGIGRGLAAIRPLFINRSYLWWWMHTQIYVLQSESTGSTFAAVSAANIANLLVPVDDLKWQDSIATFLDRETDQIDELIYKQERLIGLLDEKRQAIITHAVTKGLNPTTPTKPSDAPWVGDVPEHWSLPRLKNCSRVKRGRFLHRPRNAPHLYDGKYPFIQTGSIARAQGKYITEFSQTLSEEGLATSALLPQGTLVMAIAANIADVAILSFDSCAPDSVLGFQPTNLTSPDFLYYALTSKRAELISEAPVTSQGNLNVERVGGVTVPLPPIREQQEIVKMLDRELEQMRQISSKASSVLLLLSERRSALISAAVTGKIDVREGIA